MTARELHLASRSPRRLSLLREAGFAPRILDAGIDDATLPHGPVPPAAWVVALACLKADAGRRRLRPASGAASAVVLGADTVCVAGERVLGQPKDAADAAAMLALLQGREHRTITGVAIVRDDPPRRVVLFDAACVRWGRVAPAQLEAYLASGAWRGKAGAYNLAERMDDGWPIECAGDPTTVMGLPMRRLAPRLRALLDDPGEGPVR